jgi:hypothetical protein
LKKTAVFSGSPAVFNMAVLKTAVQSLITAVFYMEVGGGFKNRGVVANYRSLRYSEY